MVSEGWLIKLLANLQDEKENSYGDRMKIYKIIGMIVVMAASWSLNGQNPYEKSAKFAAVGKIDELLLENWKKHGVNPSGTCSDAVFLRRAHIDLIGTIPTIKETREFLSDKSPEKRSKLIDALLERPEFAQYWALKWCDILRVKSEFPINLWPNAVQAYQHWVWEAVRKNMPYNEFARTLLTASGSDFRDPPSNFYRATENKTPVGYASVAALTFMGTRLDEWKDADRKEFEKLFSRIAKKKTDEWKEVIIYLDPAPSDPMTVKMPDGIELKISPDEDPRVAFADWLIRSDNPWFTQPAVNRVWFWFFGRGIVQEPDDFRPAPDPSDSFWRFSWLLGGSGKRVNTGNPAVNQKLLEYLARSFVKSGYDFKSLCREIVNSAAYQQSSLPRMNSSTPPGSLSTKADETSAEISKEEKYFAIYQMHRLDAEVLADALCYIGGFHPKYMSVIPEPFTYIPRKMRTITLADGSITSSFLVTFGRPARDSGRLMERNNQTTYAQRLFMLNSPLIHWKVSNSPFLKVILKKCRGNKRQIVDGIYMLILARRATDKEYKTISENHKDLFDSAPPPPPKGRGKGKRAAFKKQRKRYYKNRGRKIYQMSRSLVWTLVNSKEFLFQH